MGQGVGGGGSDFPGIEAREAAILIEGRRITASGAGAVFDLMLRLIEDRLGRDCMTEVACWFQHPFVRDANASQKVPVARAGGTTDTLPAPIRALPAWHSLNQERKVAPLNCCRLIWRPVASKV